MEEVQARTGSSDDSPTLGNLGIGQQIADFLVSLRTPDISDLAHDDRECSICQETYLGGSVPETAVRLSCDHHFGMNCIRQWVECSSTPQCPLCRTILFKKEDRNDSTTLEDSIILMEQLVVDPTSTAQVLADARRQTERRITDARRRARHRRMNGETSSDRRSHDGENREVTAIQVLTKFRALIDADLYTSQPLEYLQWKRLEEEIQEVKQRVLLPHESISELWDERGPELTSLLNPMLRPLIEEFLEKLVEKERRRASRA